MRSFTALMLLILADYVIYAIFFRPVIGVITELVQAIAMMLTMRFR